MRRSVLRARGAWLQRALLGCAAALPCASCRARAWAGVVKNGQVGSAQRDLGHLARAPQIDARGREPLEELAGAGVDDDIGGLVGLVDIPRCAEHGDVAQSAAAATIPSWPATTRLKPTRADHVQPASREALDIRLGVGRPAADGQQAVRAGQSLDPRSQPAAGIRGALLGVARGLREQPLLRRRQGRDVELVGLLGVPRRVDDPGHAPAGDGEAATLHVLR